MKLRVCFFFLSAFFAEKGLYAVNGLELPDVDPDKTSVRRRASPNVGTQLSQDQASFFAFYQRCISGENADTRQSDLKVLFGQRSSANIGSDEDRFSRLMASFQDLIDLSDVLLISEIASDTSVRSWIVNPSFKTLQSAPASLENLRDVRLRNQILRTLQNAWTIWTES